MKALSILGSTGSVGTKALDVVGRFSSRYRVVGLAAGRNIQLLMEQIKTFRPRFVSVADEDGARRVAEEFGDDLTVLCGPQGLVEIATLPEADMVVGAVVGATALPPVLAAVKEGKKVALASKEVLVMAGELIMGEAKASGAQLLPIDSEHSAIFQALQGHKREDVRRIILTASGGPFLGYTPSEMDKVTVEEALNHPTWRMGRKITVDSATLMNKGLEVIEARWLFDIPVDKIEIHIHPESVVHSLVEYKDGSVIAQMAITDMRLPIAYALSYPERLELGLPPLDLVRVGKLTFLKPDEERFPNLKLAYRSARLGGSMPTVLNAANEVAVEAFLNRRIGFQDIPKIVARTMEAHEPVKFNTLEEVLDTDGWARQRARELIEKRRG